ncbi:MAG: GNAT family N-acetyltransferase [Planctomycetota bacterium]|jgi:ribosomal protein S18 acetylase RimI-like enzyme
MRIEEVDRVHEIDVSEDGVVVYKWVDGQVVPVPEEWHRLNSPDAWDRRAAGVKAKLAEGGAAVGAFDGDRLVGFAAVRYRLADDVAELVGLWVSKGYRRQGIAAALVSELVPLARAAGTRALYVSGMPSEAAQGFYRSQGFEPTVWVHRELYEKEPEDIHMIKRL